MGFYACLFSGFIKDIGLRICLGICIWFTYLWEGGQLAHRFFYRFLHSESQLFLFTVKK